MSVRKDEFLDRLIPFLAVMALQQAHRRARAAGSVLIAENGEIKEIFPDGSRITIKKIDPPVRMKRGQIIKINEQS